MEPAIIFLGSFKIQVNVIRKIESLSITTVWYCECVRLFLCLGLRLWIQICCLSNPLHIISGTAQECFRKRNENEFYTFCNVFWIACSQKLYKVNALFQTKSLESDRRYMLVVFPLYQFPLDETSFQICSMCPVLRGECPQNHSTGLLYNERKWCM